MTNKIDSGFEEIVSDDLEVYRINFEDYKIESIEIQ